MFGEEKNLKDIHQGSSSGNLGISIKDTPTPIAYTKTNKLITALYMVTDIIDKDEPLRNKLRHLGTGIISDMHCIPGEACSKISETVSFLNIASAMNIISEMNCTILKKEFLELKVSIQEYTDMKPTWLSEFFIEPDKKQISRTRIGVQKGSTLMKVLSDKTQGMSYTSPLQSVHHFDVLKKQRREEIKDSIKANNGNATIKDIKDKAQGSLLSCGEKTLQRELVSMVHESVLNKSGEKRWSRYFLI
jgi:hypothetical protein